MKLMLIGFDSRDDMTFHNVSRLEINNPGLGGKKLPKPGYNIQSMIFTGRREDLDYPSGYAMSLAPYKQVKMLPDAGKKKSHDATVIIAERLCGDNNHRHTFYRVKIAEGSGMAYSVRKSDSGDIEAALDMSCRSMENNIISMTAKDMAYIGVRAVAYSLDLNNNKLSACDVTIVAEDY